MDARAHVGRHDEEEAGDGRRRLSNPSSPPLSTVHLRPAPPTRCPQCPITPPPPAAQLTVSARSHSRRRHRQNTAVGLFETAVDCRHVSSHTPGACPALGRRHLQSVGSSSISQLNSRRRCVGRLTVQDKGASQHPLLNRRRDHTEPPFAVSSVTDRHSAVRRPKPAQRVYEAHRRLLGLSSADGSTHRMAASHLARTRCHSKRPTQSVQIIVNYSTLGNRAEMGRTKTRL